MPKTLESVKNLFDTASDRERSDYLLVAMTILRDEMRVSFELIKGEVKMINQRCLVRREICEEAINEKIFDAVDPIEEQNKDFITKKQAKVYGIIILAFSIGIGIGTGAITWWELMRRGIP